MNGNIPIVRLEVEHMRQSIMVALTEYMTKFDEDVRQAVEAVCQPEHLRQVLANAVDRELRAAIEAEVKLFFTTGAGREALRDVIHLRMTREVEDRKRWEEYRRTGEWPNEAGDEEDAE